MSQHSDAKKEKKKKILQRNRQNLEIFRALDLMRRAEDGLAAPEFDNRETEEDKRKKREEEVSWSAKTQEIRNRLDNSKRQATERWNRFAGTESAGAMGR